MEDGRNLLSFRHVALSNLLLSSTMLFLSYDISRDIAIKSPTGFKRYSHIHRVEFIYLSMYYLTLICNKYRSFCHQLPKEFYLSAINYFRIMQKRSIHEILFTLYLFRFNEGSNTWSGRDSTLSRLAW